MRRLRTIRFAVAVGGCVAVGIVMHKNEINPVADETANVSVTFDVMSHEHQIDVTYTVTNRSPAPILLLDRRRRDRVPFDEAHPFGTPDLDWAYVDLIPGELGDPSGYRAILTRSLGYADAWTDDGLLPFGRRLGPGEVVTDTFKLPLPLQENSSLHPPRETTPFRSVAIRDVEFRVGWLAEFPEATPEFSPPTIQNGAETLWCFPAAAYGWLRAREHRSATNRREVQLTGLADQWP